MMRYEGKQNKNIQIKEGGIKMLALKFNIVGKEFGIHPLPPSITNKRLTFKITKL